MGNFICRQPNGLLCRFSTVVDTVTDYNMTEEEYIEMCAERAREEARDIIDNHLMPYELIDEDFAPNNMTVEEFEKIKAEMESEVKGMSRYIDADKILKKIESRIGYFNQYYPHLIENIAELETCKEFIYDEIKQQSEEE